MTIKELNEKTELAIIETRNALQLVYDSLNQGQKQKLLKEETVLELFERYGVSY